MKKVKRILLLLIFIQGHLVVHAQKAEEKAKLPTKTVVSALAATLEKHYILEDKATAMTKMLKERLKTGAYNSITDPSLLSSKLEKDLKSVYPDKHLYVFYDPSFAESEGRKLSEQEKVQKIKKELEDLKEQNFMFSDVRILPKNVGYVRINGFFVDQVEESRETVEAAFKFVSNTSALILDLRFNGGGNPAMVSLVVSYFFKNRTHINDIEERFTGRKTQVFTDPPKSGLTLEMPVYILTSKRTYSGAEALSYSFQQLKRATIVGDTTAGGCHLTKAFTLPNGFVAEIPFARSVNPYSGENWEGTGVIPDIPKSDSDALKTAQKVIYEQRLQQSADERERKNIKWLNNQLNASLEKQPNPDLLKKYCGKYEGGSEVFLRNGILNLKNADMDNDIFKLIPINDNTFLWDENIQVEFTENLNKRETLKMIFSGGHVREKLKIND